MRVLITGGCGFLGSHIIEHLLKNTPWEITVIDKLTYASNGYDRLRDVQAHMPSPEVFGSRVRVLGCDLAQPVPAGIVQEIGLVDYIIHAAAESHVDNSILDPLPFLQSNVIGTHHLLMMARQMVGRGITTGTPGGPADDIRTLRRVFVVSTDEVYGPAGFGEPGFDELMRFRPANPYAASKAGGEAVAMAYANTYGIPVTIVNTMNLIGERQHREKFVPLVIRKALLGETVTIHADPTRTLSGTRFYLHCRTYADALTWLIGLDAGRAEGDLPLKLHVCGEREISNLDLAQLIAGYVGKPLHHDLVDFHSSRPGHDLRYAMDDSFIQALGWRRPMGIEKSLEKTVRWYLNNPRWLGL